jgi:hypothetical protein
MKSFLRLRRFARWINLPAALLVTLLQRTPVARLVEVADDFVVDSPIGTVLKGAVAAIASLGAMQSLAGATTYVLSATATSPVNGTIGVKFNQVGFTVVPTQTIGSWMIGGTIPPGMTITAAEGGPAATLSGSGGALDATTAGSMDSYGDTVDGNSSTTPVLGGTPTVAGSYTITLQAFEYGSLGGLQSGTYNFIVNVSGGAPSFTVQPQNASTAAGSSVTFSAAATSGSTYQWQKNGVNISGATSASYTIASAQSSDTGSYAVVASAGGASTTSASATLTVTASLTAAPAISGQPVGATVTSGTTVVFTVAATGTPAPTYQWKLNGNAITGATSARLVISGATAVNAGAYTCTVTNSGGATTSSAGTLAFVTTANPGRLGNISVLSGFTAGQILTVGFVTGGAGTSGTQALLIRADGPTLGSFGVAGTMADPNLKVIPLGQSVATSSNDNWSTNAAAVTAADSATGAFPLAASSLDAAEVATLTSGGYSVQVSGTGAGTALTELYDTTPIAAYTLTVPRLVNVSCNTTLPTGGTLTAGFTVGGTSNKTVLIRASGPTLAGFGLTGTMADPQIVVQASGSTSILASNAGWGGDPQIAAAAVAVNAFAFSSTTSKDSAVLLTLAPGGYSAVVNSATGGGGTTVVEVYEVP